MTYKFKSNLKCSGCEKTLSDEFDNYKEIESYSVDLESITKDVKVDSTMFGTEEIIGIAQKAGFNLEKI